MPGPGEEPREEGREGAGQPGLAGPGWVCWERDGGWLGFWSAFFLCVGWRAVQGSVQVYQFWRSVTKPLVCGQENLPLTHDVSPSAFLVGFRGCGALRRGCLNSAPEKFFRRTENKVHPLSR